MQSINVFENGIGYLAECLSLYLGSCAYLMLFILGSVYILIKGSKEERRIFLPPLVVMILTVYNPLFPVIIDKVFDISSEYYRFFWITPVIILVPFVISKLITDAKGKKEKIFAITFVIITCVISGKFIYEDGIPFAENKFKMPNELIEITEMIHEDSDEKYPKAFFEYEYNMQVRQYDPKILLTIDREEYLYAVAYSYSEEMIYDDNVPTNRILALLVRNQTVDQAAFVNALEATKTEYVVITKGHPQTSYLEECGLVLIGDTEIHNIYKYTLQEESEFDLIDYSDVEHRFSYRRLK